MNFFDNLKLSTKIFFGFFMILVLMGMIGGMAFFRFGKIDATVTHLADNLAKDQHLADQMVSKILLVRFYANKYIRDHKPEDLTRFNEEFVEFEKLLAEANKEISKEDRIKMLTSIKAGVQDYGKNFIQITQLLDKRDKILSETLDVQGPLAEQKLEQLRKTAFKAKDAIASFYAGHCQRALLLMRLNVFKYLERGNTQWINLVKEHYEAAEETFNKLDEELQEPTHRQLAQEAQTAIRQYYESFSTLQANYALQNKIVETQLDVIGPQIRRKSSDMSNSVVIDFDATNTATHTLVTHTRLQVIIVMSFAILIGIVLSFAISRSITVPLGTMIKMSNQLAVGHISQITDVQSHNGLIQITTRKDEMGDIGRAYDTLARYFRAVIEDIVQVSQGLAAGHLRVMPKAEYKGDFIQIKTSLETALSNLLQVIEDIVQVSQKLAAGDLQVTSQAEYKGDFVQIQNALNKTMIENLSSLVSQIQQSGIQLTSSATELAATTKQQKVTLLNQVDSTKKVETSVENTSQVSAELVQTMQQVAAMSEETAQFASRGQADLSRMGETMHNMENASQAISRKLETINEKTENITNVVATITKVADQTNLLSLNAAIEAEKAGEYGRGFNVVAREIRRLADQTAVATLDIENMVKEMQSAVAAGVMEMDKFIMEVQHSAKDVNSINTQMNRIIEQVQTLSPRFEEVKVAMGSQSEYAKQINNAMADVSEGMQQTTEGLEETFRTIEQLNEAAKILQNEVSRFKVKGYTANG